LHSLIFPPNILKEINGIKFKKNSNLCDGGSMTGAGGGGFAILVAKENKKPDLVELLQNLDLEKSFAANFKLNKKGITLKVN